jgi:predicted amino acid racemase
VALKQGLNKAVAVDIMDAKLLHRFQVPIGHIGHLSQIPYHDVAAAIAMNPEVITVYSVEAAKRISEVAKAMNRVQDILIKVVDKGNTFFPGQESGIWMDALIETAKDIQRLDNIRIAGVTAFPNINYNVDGAKDIEPTPNFHTLIEAAKLLENELGIEIKQINAPGNTSSITFPEFAKWGATHVEPGHGLTATTPEHIYKRDLPETIASVYVSEISHHFAEKAYAFGGGLYVCMAGGPKGYPVKALVGQSYPELLNNPLNWEQVSRDNIDYYGMLTPGDKCNVGDTVIFGFRAQAFVTRAHTAAVSGISEGKPVMEGIFDHAGHMLNKDYNPIPIKDVISKIDNAVKRYGSF